MHFNLDAPCGWNAYPGVRVSGGREVAVGIDGDDCLLMCLGDSSCVGLEFESSYGVCYLLTSTTVCNTQDQNQASYLLAKPLCCEYLFLIIMLLSQHVLLLER